MAAQRECRLVEQRLTQAHGPSARGGRCQMQDQWTQYWAELTGRIFGPLSFRLVLQPIVALVLGVLAGRRDVRLGAPLYAWSLLTDPAHFGGLIRTGLKDVGKVLVVAFAIDVAYELIFLHGLRLGQPAIIAFILVVPAYVLSRGLTNRIFRGLHPAHRPHA